MLKRLLAVTGLSAMLATSGCNIATPVFFAIHGPPKVEAVTELPQRPTVIFIDDRESKIPRRSLRVQIGKAAEQLILQKEVLPDGMVIGSQSALRAASGERSEAPISVVDIGRRVGAEVVIYVEVKGWTLSRQPGELSPAAGATIKIIDAASNQRIWPADSEGYDFIVQMQRQPESTGLTRAERNKWEEALATQIGIELAQLFYTHERTPLQDQRPG